MRDLKVRNSAGERVYDATSALDAIRWWFANGRRGDTFDGEYLHLIADLAMPAVVVSYDASGCVVTTEVQP